MSGRRWTRATWALTVAAFGALLAWVLTRDTAAAAAAFALALLALACAYAAIDEDENENDADPHPIDPYPEDLRKRLAMGRLQDRAERRRERRAGSGL